MECSEGDHRKTEGHARQALAVGKRRVIQSVQGGDKQEQHEDRRKPAQPVRGPAKGHLIPAEVANCYPAPVE